MAEVDRPVLPPYLYRYRRLDAATLARQIAAIKRQTLWCSAYKAMNDPMEGFYEPTVRFQNQTIFTAAVDQIYSAKQTLGLASFGDTHDNELMWTHYAGNYAGICVGYRTQKLVEGLPPDVHLVRLAYGVTPPEIGAADSADPRSTAIKILSHKKSSWVYEREWRELGTQGEINIASKACVRQVYLGSRISTGHRRKILDALLQSPVAIFEMRVANYSHEWKQLKNVKPASRPIP